MPLLDHHGGFWVGVLLVALFKSLLNLVPNSAGHGFLQIGSWRVAEMDSDHFSFSHSGTYTPAIYTSDGHVHSGPRHDQNSWDREPRETSTIKFGDRFIQFGEWWRLGEWEENGKHLVVSRRDSKAPMIWRGLLSSYSGTKV